MAKHILYIIALTLSSVCSAVSASAFNAGEAYKKGCELYSKNEYRAAAAEFESVADKLQSADVYYNLGNCHYRLNDYPKARLYYERALRIDPTDGDAKFNLKITLAKIKQPEVNASTPFMTTWARNFVQLQSSGAWSALCIVFFAVTLVALLVYFFGRMMWLRKVAFFGSIFTLALSVLSLVCAFAQPKANAGEAIVLQQCDVKQSPSDNSKTLQLVLPGAKIHLITGTTLKQWQQISLSDGQKGWVSLKDIAGI